MLTLFGHADRVFGISFSPDGTRLATASEDGSAKVWDAGSGKELLTLSGHTGTVWGVTFSPDGTRLATASIDGTTKVWDVTTGQELLTLTGHTNNIYSVDFSPDGTRLVTSGADGTARLYVLPIEELVALAQSRVTRSLTREECRRFLHVDQCPDSP